MTAVQSGASPSRASPRVVRWFADRSIAQKLSVGFGSLVVLTGIVVAAGILAGARVTGSIDRTTEVQAPTSLAASRAQAELLTMIGDVRGYLALGDATYRTDYEDARAAFETDLAELERLAAAAESSPATVDLNDRLAEIGAAYAEWAPQPPGLFDLHDDQLRREPALRILIQDATPRIQRVLVAAAAVLQSQEERATTAREVGTLGDMADFQSSFLAMVAGLRGYVTTGRDIFKFEYQSNATINETAWQRLAAARSRLDPEQEAQIDAIAGERAAFLELPPRMFGIVEGPDARSDLSSFRRNAVPVADRMLAALSALAADQQAQLQGDLGAGRDQLSATVVSTLVGGFAAVLLAIVLAVVFRRAIAGPIVRLTRVSRSIGEGDLTARATLESADEIGTLASTFNDMTSRLEATIGDLHELNEEQADYIREVGHVTDAAAAVEADVFEPTMIDRVAARSDALGQLARTFQRMAREVRTREERLRAQVRELTIEIDEARQARKVAEITDTDFFRDLRNRASDLRRIVDEAPSDPNG